MSHKAIHSLLFMAVPLTMCLSCGGSNTAKDPQDSIPAEITANGPQALSEYSISDTMTVHGTLYTYEFSLHNDKSAPTITNSEGISYYENDVMLTIYRGKSNEEIFTHNFRKEAFRQYLSDKEYDHITVAGFNFNYMELGKHDAFHFIIAVGDPDETTDITYNIAIDITPGGNISTHIVNNIDTEPISNDLNIDPSEDEA